MSRPGPTGYAARARPVVDEFRPERRALVTSWVGVGVLAVSAVLLDVEAAAIPIQVSQSADAVDAIGHALPLLGSIVLALAGLIATVGGRRACYTARRRREWAPSVRRGALNTQAALAWLEREEFERQKAAWRAAV